MHNQTLNPAAPNCTQCHTGYETKHIGLVVNETNTCRNCHIDGSNGFKEAHTGSSDCTQCHFANTTQRFDFNDSLFKHDHNLTVEHSYYEYINGGGMPLAINGGTGLGMFPQYTCSLTCHKTRNPEKVDKASSSWLNSSHADSRFGASDSKNNCALCKSPTNYDDNLKATNPVIAEEDWDGIQCRVCHNLHNRSYSGISGNPVAFYNATASSYVNYSVYDKVSNNTDLCERCHQPGGSHDSKFAGPHKTTSSFTCTSCHMNASFSRGMHDFQVKNTTSSIKGCDICHKSEDHTFGFTAQHTTKVDCIACHDQTFTTVNATGYAVSSDNYYGLWKETPASEWTTAKKMSTSPSTWPLHNLSKSVNCDKCHGAESVYNGSIAPDFGSGESCTACHSEYLSAVNGSMHNQTRNPGSPGCTYCHAGYSSPPHSGFVVNESNTCRKCHIDNVNGFYERHNSSSDCTTCHFANTTQPFSLNVTHDHNLTIEHNFYDYNQSGIPLISNGGIGLGTFPYYSCQMPCHGSGYGNLTSRTDLNIEQAASSWVDSAHAQSLHYPASADNKNSCAKCKSPVNYNASAPSGDLIASEDWQGIQCRVCHNLHDRKFPNDTGPDSFPVAFYNSTASSMAGHAVYDQVSSATELCEKCHTGSSHDSKFAGTHKDTVGFTCTSCHKNNTYNNQSHEFEVKNTYTGVTGCEVCHNSTQHNTAFQFTSQHENIATCEACHDKTVARNSFDFVVNVSSGMDAGLYKDPSTNKWTTYKVSHGSPATWPLHNISKSVDCNKCHGARSVYSGAIASNLTSGGTSYYTTDTLVSGYNLIALWLNPSPMLYAGNLLYNSSTGIPGVTKVLKWDSANQTWVNYQIIVPSGGIGFYSGANFTMVGYKAYFIKGNATTAGKTYTFVGIK